MLDDRHIAPDEELDIMVLTARAIEGHLMLYTDTQRDVMLPYLRGLCAYEASRPAARRPKSNILDFETALVKKRLEKIVYTERRSALVEGRNILQHGVNSFGDAVYDDID
ncbi:hypothetical protein [Rhizobium sp. Leaf383]|uniref:hypothetical protein n=1 Tax=Rhizobium sp. Leaf383 TaxID=1736357 RepID=UPI0007137CA0|nr:hypothetical protein [Rhizobium sp. Leaf383]KQS84840.1 hypothetical protein ASG58_20320 [Rhizobium sp. Leaf383]